MNKKVFRFINGKDGKEYFILFYLVVIFISFLIGYYFYDTFNNPVLQQVIQDDFKGIPNSQNNLIKVQDEVYLDLTNQSIKLCKQTCEVIN